MAYELTPLQADFLDWWVTPDEEKDPRWPAWWAEQHGLNPETCRRWRKTDWWDVALRKRLAELNVSPDRVQKVIDALFESATDVTSKQHVQAARVLLEYTQQLMPVQPVLPADRTTDQLSDAEIDELLAVELAKTRDSKSQGADVHPNTEGTS